MSLLSFISTIFAPRASADEYVVSDTYSQLRKQVLTYRSTVADSQAGDRVWGILMETGYPSAVVTLVAIDDGTISMYFSKGGGILGLGPHPGPQRAARSWLEMAGDYKSRATHSPGTSLPKVAHTRFYFLTKEGLLSIEAKTDDLGHRRHAFSPLFHKGHELITEIIKVNESLQGVKK